MTTHGLLPPFSRFAKLALDHVVRPYYSGPFWHYECLREDGATWDIAPLLASLPKPGRATLEIGSGNGRITLRLAELGYAVTALDSSVESHKALCSKIAPSMRISPVLADALTSGQIGKYDLIVIASLSINLFDLTGIATLLNFIKANALPGACLCFGVLDDTALESFYAYNGDTNSSLFIDTYKDEENIERVITTCIKYDKQTCLVKQNWFVDMMGSSIYAPRYQIGYTVERVWTFPELDKLLSDAGYVLEHDEPAWISGGGASKQKVHMVRYRLQKGGALRWEGVETKI